jgi:hypothetical protein
MEMRMWVREGMMPTGCFSDLLQEYASPYILHIEITGIYCD